MGMFVVNFLGHHAVTHHLLKHNNTHFSWADSIMPSFILISGYSFRLTFQKRSNSSAADMTAIRKKFLLRSLGLILLSLMLFGFGDGFDSYSEVSFSSVTGLFVALLKANLWEVLAIIGACQIILLPLVSSSVRLRFIALVAMATAHLCLSWWFNWNFVYGLPNGLDDWLGTSGKRAWDGGLFGLLSWSEIMLMGTLLPDIVAGLNQRGVFLRLCTLGIFLMAAGYSASCLTRLYDKLPPNSTTVASGGLIGEGGISELDTGSHSEQISPVIPDWNRMSGRTLSSMLAEPPMVPPPPKEIREPNYWAMDKRIVSQSFVFFSAGFSIFLYAFFARLTDGSQFTFGPFATFGQNPLAAYIIHHFVTDSITAFFPKDSAGVWATFGMLLSIWITYLFVSFLSKRELFLRL